TEKSPHPTLSTRMNTMLGLVSAAGAAAAVMSTSAQASAAVRRVCVRMVFIVVFLPTRRSPRFRNRVHSGSYHTLTRHPRKRVANPLRQPWAAPFGARRRQAGSRNHIELTKGVIYAESLVPQGFPTISPGPHSKKNIIRLSGADFMLFRH